MADVEFKDNSNEIKRDVNQQIKKALEIIGMKIRDEVASKLTSNKSVVTGRLRNSIAYAIHNKADEYSYSDDFGKTYSGKPINPEDGYVVIGTPVEYAESVEMKKPYLRPAIMNNQDMMQQIFDDCIKG